MRTTQRESVDNVLEAVRTGRSAALVVHGEGELALPGEFRVSRVAGARSDRELTYSGLHQLCAQALDQFERLSPPQREVLRAAFDPAAETPDPSLVGFAVFSLLAHAAEKRPLVCVISNTQRLDKASRQALGFASRRLVAESVALLFLVGDAGTPAELVKLPEAWPAEAPAREVVTAG
ncbi:MAG TPA: hypothetical protein VJT49_01995 [Amycolatopsis sp.]|uniref:hypothetical protein n=1 Tax=Amycolatopsis sp. TaxID=37632 RepID=UPI002B499BA6|nr:hypothetical protein [Amycolatopsis sp.]HKS43884.1 hypothetical protein [Amycolatopsis sp.]